MKVIVIGAGPAGIMSAISAANAGADIVLLEKNRKIGKKLFITGKGRCNITNNCTEEEFIKNVATNPKFLYSAIRAFPPSSAMEMIEGAGCPLKTERGGRVFPESDKSSDVLSAFSRLLAESGVKVILGEKVEAVKITEEGFNVITEKTDYVCDRLIICSGGVSYPLTGSSGEMFSIIKKMGHNIVPLKPALCPILIKEDFITELAGLSLKNVRVWAITGGKKVFEDFGEMLFTHSGVSGPLILTMSSYLNKLDISDAKIGIDLKPALDEKTLIARINRDFLAQNNKDYRNSLDGLLPKSLIPVIIKLSGTDPEKKVNSVTAKERSVLASLLKNFMFTVSGLDKIDVAIVISGGVDTREINPSTMESRIVKGLYFAGEGIDIDALTGGFNIQAALSTGYLAGKNSVR